MSLLVFSCFGLPILGVMYALYFILRKAGLQKQSLIAKCGGSFVAVGSAGMALYFGGLNPLTQVVFWFFVLCATADVLLELHFVTGMLTFAAAHVCLLIWLWGTETPVWWSLIIWVVIYAFTCWLFRKELPTLGKLIIPFCLYPALLGGTVALAVPLFFRLGATYWPAALGTVCFFISDMFVAKQELSHLDPKYHKLVMVLYWAALYLIAANLW